MISLTDQIGLRRQVLAAVFRSKPKAEFFRKRDRLLQGPLKTLESIWGVCDLRPVFDVGRQSIQETLPVVIVRLRLEDDTGEEDELVFQATEESLEKIEEFLKATKSKLAICAKRIEVRDDKG